MNEEPVSDALLRQFLLGQVDDQERQRLESMFVTGALSRERVIAAEQHLLDDYLDDSLTPADKERFLAQYGETPVEQRRLRIAKSIQDWAESEAAVTAVGATSGSPGSRPHARFRLKPVIMIPIAAVTVLAIVCASVWLRSRWEQRSRHLALQQELVRLNTESLSDISPYAALRPGTVRSGEAENVLTVPANVESVALGLRWTQGERFPSYQATISRIGEDESFTIPKLRLDSGNVIRLKLSPRFLTRGLYRIEVSGIDANGATGPAEEYQFQVNS
jgi:anti-sigma factor RsiW